MKLFARLRRPKKARGNILFRYGWKITLLLLLAGAAFAVFLFYGTWAQTFDMKNVGEMPERSTVYDVDGKIYSRLAGANRLKVSLSEVSPQFIAAVLAREDTRFYEHKGIDWRGVLRALARDILDLTLEHLFLVSLSMAIAAALAIPAGILLTRRAALRKWLLGFASVMQTIPSLALFGFLLPAPWIGERADRNGDVRTIRA